MSFDYATLQKDVQDMLEEFGTSMVLSGAAEGGTYDPVTGETTPGGDAVLTPFIGVKMGLTQEYTQSVGAGNVQARDMLIMAGPDINPKLDQTVIYRNEVWQIVNIVAEEPADTPIMYTLQVRP